MQASQAPLPELGCAWHFSAAGESLSELSLKLPALPLADAIASLVRVTRGSNGRAVLPVQLPCDDVPSLKFWLRPAFPLWSPGRRLA